MSIVTIINSPPVWSPAYNPIVWKVDSDETTKPKFRYVFDVYVDNDTPVRFKVPPNPFGKGTIDVSTFVQSKVLIPENLPFLDGAPFLSGQGLAAKVYIKVGEEYASSLTSEALLYDGLGNLGEPAFGLYALNEAPALDATTPVIAWAAALSPDRFFNYVTSEGADILPYQMSTATPGKFLTDCPLPHQNIRSDETFTLSWIKSVEDGTAAGTWPYAVRSSLYKDGVYLGYSDSINTEANGGYWPSCSVLPSLTGLSGPAFALESFKTSPDFYTSLTKDQQVLFNGNFGCSFTPIPQIFPGYHASGLTPAANPLVPLIPNGNFIQPQFTSDCNSPFGIGTTGWSELAYRDMQVLPGDVIEIQVPSDNTWGVDYPSLRLWGSTGASNSAATWEEVGTFTISQAPVGKITYTFSTTSTKTYSALGIRFFAGTTLPCGNWGCFSNYWRITTPIQTTDFDSICFTLHGRAGTVCETDEQPISEPLCLKVDDTNCWGFEPIRFTWTNPLGGRDWYTFIKRNTFTQSAERSSLYRLEGYWSSAGYSASQSSPARFGNTVFNIDLINTWTASTDWLSEAESAWLREMFASPSVFAYLPGRSQPVAVIIQDAEYSVQTFARQKLFQFFVSFQEAQPANTQGY